MNPCSMVGCTSTFSIGQSASSPLGSLPTPPPETLTMNKGINSQEDFFSFVKNTEDVSKVNFDEAQKLIQKGKCFLQHLREGAIKDCPREEGRALIIPLMWYLMSRAFEKKSGFSEGMIVLEDPNHLVANFFSRFGSRRLSSHYPGRVANGSFGIDQYSKLPAGFRTVLFGKLLTPPGEGEWTFFKPETHGTEGLCELTLHGWSYCVYQFRKILGKDAEPFDRKEEILPSFTEEIRTLIDASIIDQSVAKQWGLSGVFRTLILQLQNPSIPPLSSDKQQLVQRFLSDAVARYDWLNIRHGDEVVLSCDGREDGRVPIGQLL